MRFPSILKFTGLSIFAYLLLLSLSYSHQNSAYQPIFILLSAAALYFSKNGIIYLYQKYGATRTFLGILLLGCTLRYLWAIFAPTLPFSDFKVFFHDNAINLSQDIAVTSKNMGYTLLLSAGYRVFPDILTGKLLNATASTLSILILYLLGSKLINPVTGLFAAFIFALLPSEILMVSVLGTEVFATTMGIITAFFISYTKYDRGIYFNVSLLLAGLFYGLGLSIRSSFIFYFPAIIILIFIFSIPNYKKIVVVFMNFSAGIIVALGLFWTGNALSTKQFSWEILRTQDSFPLFSGTNIGTSGTWTQEDWDLYLTWPADQRDRIARQEAIIRIKSNPIGFLKIIPRKFALLMGPNDYGNMWSLRNVEMGTKKLLAGLISQSIYVIILLGAFYAFVRNQNATLLLIVLTLVIFTLVPHIFLEVQGRYHHYIMPFIVLQASVGLQQINLKGK